MAASYRNRHLRVDPKVDSALKLNLDVKTLHLVAI
jgi:hypothetical protein